MNRPAWALTLNLLLAGACRSPEYGTFVGNPTLTAGVDDTEAQRGRGGHLEASEVFLHYCEGEGQTDDVPLGPIAFDLGDAGVDDAAQIPEGHFCDLFLIVQHVDLTFDDAGVSKSLAVDDGFDLTIAQDLRFADGEHHRLRLGDPDWLASLAANMVEGLNDPGTDPALNAAFFDGLAAGSSVELLSDEADEPLPGRLDLEGYPESPDGVPSRWPTCGPGVDLDLAIPIPPAAMAATGLGDEVGWCQGPVSFSGDLGERTSTQVDHSDGSTYTVSYNGWGQGCDDLHCDTLFSANGDPLGIPCTVLAWCDPGTGAVVTGFEW